MTKNSIQKQRLFSPENSTSNSKKKLWKC